MGNENINISSYLLFLTVFIGSLIHRADSISVIYQKKNILVKQNNYYIFQVGLQKANADLIPSYVNIQYDVYNYNGTSCNYFDFFYYVSQADIECYERATGNGSYLFPCPFLSNNYAIIRTNKVSALNQMPKLQINKIQNLNYTFIVDNTKFPFPTGAYPYNDINVNIKTTLSIQISSSYEELAFRLISINATILAIFIFIIGCLVFKERNIRKQMEGDKKSNQLEKILSAQEDAQQNQRNSSDSEQEQNYTDFMGKTALAPSLLSSNQRSILVNHNAQ